MGALFGYPLQFCLQGGRMTNLWLDSQAHRIRIKAKPVLAAWIERALSLPGVFESRLSFAIVAFRQEMDEDHFDYKLYDPPVGRGHEIVHQLRVNILGAAYVGRIGNIQRAWQQWCDEDHKVGYSFGWTSDGEFLGLTGPEARRLLNFHCHISPAPLPALEIARRLREKGL